MSTPSGSQRSSSWLPLLGLIGCSFCLGSAHVFARLSYAHHVNVTTAATAQSILDNPAGFYFNVHTAANPAGVMRGQLSKS